MCTQILTQSIWYFRALLPSRLIFSRHCRCNPERAQSPLSVALQTRNRPSNSGDTRSRFAIICIPICLSVSPSLTYSRAALNPDYSHYCGYSCYLVRLFSLPCLLSLPLAILISEIHDTAYTIRQYPCRYPAFLWSISFFDSIQSFRMFVYISCVIRIFYYRMYAQTQ